MSRKNLSVQNKLTIIDQNSIGKYLQELNVDKDTLALSPELERALFMEYRLTKSKVIKDRLTKANLRWVVTIAKQFNYPKTRLEDLINEGTLGMIRAIDKFDVTRGNGFLSYATWYIRQEISLYINETLADVVQPANRYRINKLITQAEGILRSKGNDAPTIEQLIEVYFEIKENTDPVLSVADYLEIKTQSKGFVSMEIQLADKDGDDMTLANTFKSGTEYTADHILVKEDKQYEINKMLSDFLNEREREIVEYSFGLNGREEKTLDQIHLVLGITRERVGQLLQGAILKLKKQKKLVYELCGTEKETVHSIEANHAHYAMKG